mgnify:CR=1 FL=1
MKKSLVISIIIFFLVAGAALYLVLNKGHIGEYSLVSLETEPEEVIPVISLELEKAYLSSQDEEDVCKVIVKVDGVKFLQRIVIPEVYRHYSGDDSQTHEKRAYGLKQFLPLPSPAQIPDNDKNRKAQIEAQHGVLDPQQNTRPNTTDHRFSKG